MRAILVLAVVLFAGGVVLADDPQHSIKVNVQVKPVRQPGPFARLFARKPAPAPVVMVPLSSVPEAAKVATLTALVAGVPSTPAPAASPAVPTAARSAPTVRVEVSRP